MAVDNLRDRVQQKYQVKLDDVRTAISEVGAVMMVGGNLSVNGHNMTGTMTTATMALVRQGNYAAAVAFGLILLFLAFVITFVLTRTQQGIRRRWLQS